MAKTRVSSTDLVWIFREKLVESGVLHHFPIAIVPDDGGWRAVADKWYTKRFPLCAKRVALLQDELRNLYDLKG